MKRTPWLCQLRCGHGTKKWFAHSLRYYARNFFSLAQRFGATSRNVLQWPADNPDKAPIGALNLFMTKMYITKETWGYFIEHYLDGILIFCVSFLWWFFFYFQAAVSFFDLSKANVLIQISSQCGSMWQETPRLRRIFRPKKGSTCDLKINSHPNFTSHYS